MKIAVNVGLALLWISCLLVGVASLYQLGEMGILSWTQLFGVLLGAVIFIVPLIRFVKDHEYAPTDRQFLFDIACTLLSMIIMIRFVEEIHNQALLVKPDAYGYLISQLAVWATWPQMALIGSCALVGNFSTVTKQSQSKS